MRALVLWWFGVSCVGCIGTGAHSGAAPISVAASPSPNLLPDMCAGGDMQACGAVGKELASSGDKPGALRMFVTACLGKATDWCYSAGQMFEHGLGADPDATVARINYETACEGGLAVACFALAELHIRGKGSVSRDVLSAYAHARRGCRLGWPAACSRVREIRAHACRVGLADACTSAPDFDPKLFREAPQ